jgi:ketosteroid isomerase-like protein
MALAESENRQRERAMIERISLEVHDILTGDNRAVILGSRVSKLKRTGKIIKTDFAIVLIVANVEIVRFQMLEDSFAVLPGGT